MTVPTRRLGSRGPVVSAIGLGCNTLGTNIHGDDAVALVRAAIDLGVTFFDTADVYGEGRSEELLGRALAISRPADVVVATKVRWPVGKTPGGGGSLSEPWILAAADASLGRLGCERIDLYQLHAPDPSTPLEESVGALKTLVEADKIRWAGCSNFPPDDVERLVALCAPAGVPFVSIQNLWNVIDGIDEPGVLPIARHHGLGVIPHSPLAWGILTGKYRLGQALPAASRAADRPQMAARITPERLAKVEKLRPWADDRGHSLSELALAWLLAQPEVSTVIAGARSEDQLKANLAATAWPMSVQDRADIAGLLADEASPVK